MYCAVNDDKSSAVAGFTSEGETSPLPCMRTGISREMEATTLLKASFKREEGSEAAGMMNYDMY
jgi:hypothetical protein